MIRTFKALENKSLVIMTRKHAIIFSRPIEQNSTLNFDDETFEDLTVFLQDQANECWDKFVPKEPTSIGSDYEEYYDRKLGNNGYLYIGEHSLKITRPVE